MAGHVRPTRPALWASVADATSAVDVLRPVTNSGLVDGSPLLTMQHPWLLLALAATAAAQSSNVSESLMWGAYRPNLYFGTRPQIPQSLMTGLMWFGTHDFQSFSSKLPQRTIYVFAILTLFQRLGMLATKGTA